VGHEVRLSGTARRGSSDSTTFAKKVTSIEEDNITIFGKVKFLTSFALKQLLIAMLSCEEHL